VAIFYYLNGQEFCVILEESYISNRFVLFEKYHPSNAIIDSVCEIVVTGYLSRFSPNSQSNSIAFREEFSQSSLPFFTLGHTVDNNGAEVTLCRFDRRLLFNHKTISRDMYKAIKSNMYKAIKSKRFLSLCLAKGFDFYYVLNLPFYFALIDWKHETEKQQKFVEQAKARRQRRLMSYNEFQTKLDLSYD